MAEKYTLYLDESGDFDKDLDISWKNECLVGGLLVKEALPLKQEKARQILISSWTKTVPADAALPPEQIFRKARHATELQGGEKAAMVASVLEEAEKCGEFIVFENYQKTRILNSTLTYVNIMADGIIQLLGRLVAEHPHARVKLDVIAGFRKDTTAPVSMDRLEGYIDRRECLDRIRERLELARVKNHAVCTGKAELSFCYEDDKTNSCLILCDYICNFYLTRTAPVYRTVRENLLQKYQSKNMFSLYGNAERERAIAHCTTQDYDSALYDICTGLIRQPDTINIILTAFLQVPEGTRHNYLRILSTYFHNLIGGQRNLELGSRVLNQAEILSERLKDAGAEDLLFTLDIALYKLTICSHLGQLKPMEPLFETCRKLLEKVLVQTENLHYAFLYYNRYAVYLIDTFRMQEAFELLEQVKQQFMAYELILGEFPTLHIPKQHIRSDQLGRILGTQVQCLRWLMTQNACDYETAIQVSDQAIRNLTLDADKRRQYQYRSHIEAAAGNYEAALSDLCRGFDVTGWEAFFMPPLLSDSFALYHLSCFVRSFAENAEQYPDIAKILRKFRDNEKAFFRPDSYPAFLTCANVARAMHVLSFDTAMIKRYYKTACTDAHALQAVSTDGPHRSILFQVLKLMLQAEYIVVLKHRKDPEEENALAQLRASYESLKDSDLPESFRKLFDDLEQAFEENTAAAFLAFAKLRQY